VSLVLKTKNLVSELLILENLNREKVERQVKPSFRSIKELLGQINIGASFWDIVEIDLKIFNLDLYFLLFLQGKVFCKTI
jgi:hypothetical protein